METAVVDRGTEQLRPIAKKSEPPSRAERVKKAFFLGGLFLFLFGLASSTKEFLGCITLPIDGIFYLFGTTSHRALAFFLDISKYFVMAGVFVTAASLIFFMPMKGEVKANVHFRKWHTWKKRRTAFQFFVLSLIIIHISAVALKKSALPSLCPLSFAELGNFGIFGPAALFWAALFALVLVFGRALCGWACVYTPVQEQASTVLTALGKPPARKKLGKRWIIYVLTSIFWSTFVVNVFRSMHKLNFGWGNGLHVGSLWLFFTGLLTIFPITLFLTHALGSRYFCKYLCPLGGTMSLYSKLGLLRMKLEPEKCVDCGLCDRNCQMGVAISSYVAAKSPSIRDGRCIVCGDCADVCSKDAISLGFGG